MLSWCVGYVHGTEKKLKVAVKQDGHDLASIELRAFKQTSKIGHRDHFAISRNIHNIMFYSSRDTPDAHAQQHSKNRRGDDG